MLLSSLSGWLLSIYPDAEDGVVLWIAGEDGTRKRLTHSLLSTFYVGGEQKGLDAISHYLERDPYRVHTERTEREDLFEGPQKVLAIQTANPIFQKRLTSELKRRFSSFQLRYYNTSVPLSVRYAVEYGVFPTGRCFVTHDEQGNILDISSDDSPWEIDYDLPGLRMLTVEPDANPRFAQPRSILLSYGDDQRRLLLDQPVQVLQDFTEVLNVYDPDIIVAQWGDGWLFPTLLHWAKEFGVPFNPSRDARHPFQLKSQTTFQSYGVVHHRDEQTFLFGREHLDPGNTTLGGFNLASIFELARVTSLPLQVAGRNSPGAGFTAMQIAEALRRGILVPEHKRQTEPYRSAFDFNAADKGGLNYRPVVGLHEHVAPLDYFSMYPSLMVAMNISGETVGKVGKRTVYVPVTNVPISQDKIGLVPAVLIPVLDKRDRVKGRLEVLVEGDLHFERLTGIADSLKSLGYVSFGYQGFLHNIFGSIQAHEAITAFGREMLVRAIEAAQDLGFSILAANTDSLFVKQPGYATRQDFQPLVEEINRRTGLSIRLEPIFDWIAFLPSKGNPRIGAVNRYFGRMQNRKAKVRGLAQRRYDTPEWIVQVEKEVLALLLTEPDGQKLRAKLPTAVSIVRRRMDDLYQGRVHPIDLIVTRRLSREIERFRGKSEAASAARQMRDRFLPVQVGQKVEYIYVRTGLPGVRAVDYQSWPEDSMIEKQRYCELLMRAIFQVLIPMGIRERDMPSLTGEGVRQLDLFEGNYVR
jgi:DNA polymerase-2